MNLFNDKITAIFVVLLIVIAGAGLMLVVFGQAQSAGERESMERIERRYYELRIREMEKKLEKDERKYDDKADTIPNL